MSGVPNFYSPGMQIIGQMAQASLNAQSALQQAQAQTYAYGSGNPFAQYNGSLNGLTNAAHLPRPESEMDKRLRLIDEGIAELEIAWAPALARMAERLAA